MFQYQTSTKLSEHSVHPKTSPLKGSRRHIPALRSETYMFLVLIEEGDAVIEIPAEKAQDACPLPSSQIAPFKLDFRHIMPHHRTDNIAGDITS